MAALPVKEAQCRQMFSSCGGGRGRSLNPAGTEAQGRTEPACGTPTKPSLTLSVRVTSAPRVRSMRITSMCLCSAAQMMGVHPPLSWGRGGKGEGGDSAPALLTQSPGSTIHRQWGLGAGHLRSLGLNFFIYKLGLIVSMAQDCKVIFLFLKYIS